MLSRGVIYLTVIILFHRNFLPIIFFIIVKNECLNEFLSSTSFFVKKNGSINLSSGIPISFNLLLIAFLKLFQPIEFYRKLR